MWLAVRKRGCAAARVPGAKPLAAAPLFMHTLHHNKLGFLPNVEVPHQCVASRYGRIFRIPIHNVQRAAMLVCITRHSPTHQQFGWPQPLRGVFSARVWTQLLICLSSSPNHFPTTLSNPGTTHGTNPGPCPETPFTIHRSPALAFRLR